MMKGLNLDIHETMTAVKPRPSTMVVVTMERGATEVSSSLGLNHSFADILTGIILFFIIATEFFITYKVTLRKSGKKEG